MAHLTVHVKTADGGPLPAGTQIMLMRDRKFGPSQALDSKGAASWNSMPGDYSFHVNPSQGRMFFVSRVSHGERPLPSNDIHLSAGESASFVVTVSAGTHTLRGVTQVDGKPAHGVFVLLVPTAELHNIHTAFRYQSDLDGSFQIAGVPPGDYTLVAIQDGWSVNWDEPSILGQYLSGATTVHIPDGSPAVQTLPGPITVQAR
jgi:hypothetical protein